MCATEIMVSKKMVFNIPALVYCDGAPSPKPLVILSHGFGGNKETLIPYLEDLASRGYIAVGIDNRLHGERVGESFQSVFYDEDSLNCYRLFNAIKETAEDIRLIIDHFTLENRVDIKRIAMLGISMGGFTTYRAVSIDKRIKAAVTFISSPVWGDVPGGAKIDERDEVKKAFAELSELFAPASTPDNFYPTALLMQAGAIDDHFSLDKLKIAYSIIKQRYKSNPDLIKLKIYDAVGHTVTPEMWENALIWLYKHLQTI